MRSFLKVGVLWQGGKEARRINLEETLFFQTSRSISTLDPPKPGSNRGGEHQTLSFIFYKTKEIRTVSLSLSQRESEEREERGER